MSITLPARLEHFRHDEIVHLIKQLNSEYKLPRRGSWGEGIPDLEESITRQVVEVAVARDLKTVWGQCVYYYRMGASHIHLVLSPRLFHRYRNNECAFVKENPIPNMEVYPLPDTNLPLVVSHKATVKQTKHAKPTIPKHVPVWPFLASDVTPRVVAGKLISDLPQITDSSGSLNDEGVDDDYDDASLSEPGLLSGPKQEIQCYGDHPCIGCKTRVEEDTRILCTKHGWIIVKELAAKQRLCAF